jgi:acyl dehydratase
MSLSPAVVGRTYGPTAAYEVSAAKIAEFAGALGDTNPAYGGDQPIAPPTFAAVIAAQSWDQLWADPELGLALHRIVHVDQSFQSVRPLRAGDRVQANLTISAIRQRGPLTYLTLAVTVSDTSGELIVTSTSTVLHNGAGL